MRIAVVHNAVRDADAPDEKDVLVQARAVTRALTAAGHDCRTFPCTLDLSEILRRITDFNADRIFNLVESLDGRGRLIHLLPFALDAYGLPYTGCSAEAQLFTSNKLMAKERMAASGIATPEWAGPFPNTGKYREAPSDDAVRQSAWIIKSVWEHASIGLDETGLIRPVSGKDLESRIRFRANRLGGEDFAERFIEGREFNLSLLAGPEGPEILPPAEILFEGYGEDKPKIVDYRAKWDETSYEYHHTPRRFDFGPEDRGLIGSLSDIAGKCWKAFGLAGYVRVDFRVDETGRPWVLEVNTNPCLSPDAGFAAALERAGISFAEAIRRILGDVRETQPRRPSDIVFRREVHPEDPERIRALVEITGFFSPEEVAVAKELADERRIKGDASGYYFVFAERAGRLLGYSCYGPIPCTAHSYDLYWIAVHPEAQGEGIGRQIVRETERLIRASGGSRIYADTSERPQYAPTRAFYEACGFYMESLLKDFYAPGDGKAIYVKPLDRVGV